MESLKIILLCVVAAIIYGVLHDQVTARVCVEYFTIGHPLVFRTHSPTLLALGWGVIATWWVGVILGIPAALVSQVGSWPRYTAAALVRPIGGLMLVMAGASLLAGVAGYMVAKAGGVWLVEPLASRVPATNHNAFLADLWAHLGAYGVGLLGGIALCGWVLIQRRRMAIRGKGRLPGSTSGSSLDAEEPEQIRQT
jgi:hypothetical protein